MIRLLLLAFFVCSTASADLEQSVSDLSAGTFHQRKAARNDLLDAGPAAIPFLEKHLNSTDPQLRSHARTLLHLINLGIRSDTPQKAIPLIKAFVSAKPDEQEEIFETLVSDRTIPLTTTFRTFVQLFPEVGPPHSRALALAIKLGEEILAREEELSLPSRNLPPLAGATLIAAWHKDNKILTSIADEIFSRYNPETIVPLVEGFDLDITNRSITDLSRKALAAGQIERARRILTSSSSEESQQHLTTLDHIKDGTALPEPSGYRTGDWKALLKSPDKALKISTSTKKEVDHFLKSLLDVENRPNDSDQSPFKEKNDLSPWTALERSIASHNISSALDHVTILSKYEAIVGLHLSAGRFSQIEQIKHIQQTQLTGSLGCEIPFLQAPIHLKPPTDYADLFSKTSTARSRDITALLASAVQSQLFEMALAATIKELNASRLTEQHIPAALFPNNQKMAHWLLNNSPHFDLEKTLKWISRILSQKATQDELDQLFVNIQEPETTHYGHAATVLTFLELYPNISKLKTSASSFPEIQTNYRERNRFSALLKKNDLLDENAQFWKTIVSRNPTDASAHYQNGDIRLARLLPLSDPAQRLALARTMESCQKHKEMKHELTLISLVSPLDQSATITTLRMLGNSAFHSRDFQKTAHLFSLHSIGTLLSDKSYSSIYSYITPASRMAESYGMIALNQSRPELAKAWFTRARAIDISADLLGKALIEYYKKNGNEKEAAEISDFINQQEKSRLSFTRGEN